jgi:thiol-disulfide isomerase/thioredoxin
MYGLSKMLSDYHVENAGFRIKDREEMISELETPFIAHAGGDFVTVSSIRNGKVTYIWKHKRIVVSTDEFVKSWSGTVLIAEPDENSAEPDYKAHRREETAGQIKTGMLVTAVLLLLGMAGFYAESFSHAGWLTALVINGIGIYAGYLLILKQMHVHSHYADRICSLLNHQNDCNNLLESDASWFMGLFSWSEIGLGYFVANTLLILFCPTLYPYAALINIFILPYTLWSVWYQKSVAGQWCPLCLTVQGVLWLLFINNLIFGLIRWPDFTVNTVLLAGCIYAVPVLLLNILVPNLSDKGKMEEITQEINSLKADEEIFRVLLKAKPRHEGGRTASQVLWGSPYAKNLITVVTNPHCNPCAKMHSRLEQLLENTNNGYCIQYVLTSFNEELEKSSKLFIAMYHQKDIPAFLSFLDDWYKNGKNSREEFYGKYPFNREDEALLSEYQRHKDWINETKIRATPSILFNGYELPEQYRVEDLKYFTKMDLK